jgi:sarcosine oxidase subunit gamma
MVELAIRKGVGVSDAPGLRLLAPQARFILRGGADAWLAAGSALGFELPMLACRGATAGARAALWLGPDEQLLLADGDGAQPIGELLERALTGLPHSLVDVSHRQCAFEASGPRATELLNSGCPLDLDIRSFPVGMCTRTLFAKAEIVLWRTAERQFRIEVWRSFADYFAGLWREAARDGSG